MKIKRILALLLAVVMVFALAACKGTDEPKDTGETKNTGETYELKVKLWVPDKAVDLTKKQIEAFNANNDKGIKVIPEIDALSEADSATQVLNDVQNAADLFFFAQDQFARLVRGGALAEIPADMVSTIAAENNASVVAAGKSGDKQYAYPLTNDNGYFMYYDKSVIKEEDLDSLEKLIAACESAKKYFAFEQDTSAWYNASFFFGAGCHSEWLLDDDGKIVSVDDDFDSDKGLIAVKGMEKLVKSEYHLSSSSADEFSKGAAIVVTGTWAFDDIKGILGDNLGAADLPSFEVDGKEYHLGSFSGCKLLGVKPQSDATKQVAVHILAQYLTSEAAQLERFNELAWGPANTKAANDPAVLANPGLVALNQQNQYAVPQGQIDGAWWDIAKVISTEVKEAKSEADLKAALTNYHEKIAAIFTMSEADKEAMSVIGSICGTSWDTDIPMTKNGDAYESEVLELHKGEEFKFRQGKSWDVNFGSDGQLNGPNFVVESSGKYKLILTVAEDFTSAECKMELIEAIEDGPEESKPDTWGVVGSMTGWGNDAEDFPMSEAGASFVSAPIELHAGDELKCRKNADWAENYPADNVVVDADGFYTVVLDITAGTVTLEPAEAPSWGVVGSMTGWGGDAADFPMHEDGGKFVSDPIELHAGDELKCRFNSDWAENFPADNVKVEADGTYIVVLDKDAGTVELQAQ